MNLIRNEWNAGFSRGSRPDYGVGTGSIPAAYSGPSLSAGSKPLFNTGVEPLPYKGPSAPDPTVPPSWNENAKAMPSSAVEALDSAIGTAADPDSYRSINGPTKLDKLLSSLQGGSASAPQAKAPDIEAAKLTLAAIAPKLVGEARRFARGGIATDAVAQALALLTAMGGQQQPQAASQQPGQPVRAAVGMYVGGNAGDGVSDSVDAKLSVGEYVIPADVVSALGKGSSEAGAAKLDQLVQQTRASHVDHMTSMPPPR